MRILVIGAGAIGGYFGARLLEAGRDVTFLVRPRRADMLRTHGLTVRSPQGDLALAEPPLVTADEVGTAYDLVLLSCKAYDLDGAMDAMAPAVGPDTAILPLLNGIGHLERLDARFGAGRVLGGLSHISASLDETGAVLHLNDIHSLTYGERDGAMSARVRAIEGAMDGVRIDARASPEILQDMWEKWMFIATLAGITCLMRASVGDIVKAGGDELTLALFDECAGIGASAGYTLREAFVERSRRVLTMPGADLKASMLRDVERGGRTEVDHILADLLARAPKRPGSPVSLFRAAIVNLRAHEAGLARG